MSEYKVTEQPFQVGDKVRCWEYAKEVSWNACDGVCACTKDNEYTVDAMVWSTHRGWMVSITNELHPASSFELANPATNDDKERINPDDPLGYRDLLNCVPVSQWPEDVRQVVAKWACDLRQ